MKALIHDNKVVDVSETPFEVHEDLFWVDATNDVVPGWFYDNGNFKEPELPKYNYFDRRRKAYPNLSEFADAYYWAQKGDNTKMDEYVAKCDAVKEKFPKVNDAN